jgi:hypothetical protein
MNVRFKVNLLSSNFEETYYIQLTTKNYSFVDMDFGYDKKQMPHISKTKFPGMVIDVLETPYAANCIQTKCNLLYN